MFLTVINFPVRKKSAKSKKKAAKRAPRKARTVKTATVKKRAGNIFDTFAKLMFGRILVIVDLLLHYADPMFVSKIDLKKITPAPTHCITLALMAMSVSPISCFAVR